MLFMFMAGRTPFFGVPIGPEPQFDVDEPEESEPPAEKQPPEGERKHYYRRAPEPPQGGP
jgi:hypothetical protein